MADETPLPSADPASPASPHAPEDAWQARKCALLRDFGAWLDALPPAEALADVAAGEREAELPGLAQVFAETTALRQETRQVARQSREMGEALRAAGEALAAIGQRLGLAEAAVEAARARAADAAWKGKAEMAAERAAREAWEQQMGADLRTLRRHVAEYEGRTMQLEATLRAHGIDVPPWTMLPGDGTPPDLAAAPSEGA